MLMRFTPRRRRSKWSQINRERAQQLIAQGKMKPAGLAAVQAAKTDGRWDAAYPAQSAAPVPDDLRRALDENPRAKAFFATLTGSNALRLPLSPAPRPRRREARQPDHRVR